MEISSYFRNALLASSGLIAVYAMPSSLETRMYADEPVAANPDLNKKNAPAEKSLEEKVLDRINHYRNIAGLDPVTLDPELSKACQLHANYLMVNNLGSRTDKNEQIHSEDPNLPRYTKEGAKIAKFCDIGFSDEPIESIDAAMSTFFHRISYFDPRLEKVGFGYSFHTNKRTGKIRKISVINAYSKNTVRNGNLMVAFPVNNQREVPTSYREERPDPIPKDQDRVAGFPITITFYDWNYPTNATASLKKIKKKKDNAQLEDIEFWFSSPEQPVDTEHQGPTICLTPKDPLEHDTTYEVTITGKLNDQPWEKTWQFTTVKSNISETVMPNQK